MTIAPGSANRGGDTAPQTAEAPAVARGDFLVIAGHGRLITHQLDRAESTIGRDASCDVTIDHPALSRRHAVLRLGPPLTIQDLGSTNGVRVSRRTVRGGHAVALEPGETFHVGGFSFNVVGQGGRRGGSNRSGLDRLRVDDPTAAGVADFVRDVAAAGASVLILGESGVGKDVLAETLHALSGRAGALARVNCAALAEPLIESELFGHEKGAFTGAAGSNSNLAHWKVADVTGDGRTDLVEPYVAAGIGLRIHSLVRNASGVWTFHASDIAPGYANTNLANWKVMDIDGDYIADLVEPYYLGSGLRIHRARSNWNGTYTFGFQDMVVSYGNSNLANWKVTGLEPLFTQ